MASVSLTGGDTIQVDGRNLNDLADGDAVMLTYPDDLAKVKAGKNGNLIYAFNNTGLTVECTIRLLLGSSDDKYLNSRLQEQIQDFSSFILATGDFTKRVGDGQGNLADAVYQMTGGVFARQVDAKTSAEGDTEQSVAVYKIHYGNGQRAIQ